MDKDKVDKMNKVDKVDRVDKVDKVDRVPVTPMTPLIIIGHVRSVWGLLGTPEGSMGSFKVL